MVSNWEEIPRLELVERLFNDPVKNWTTKFKNLADYLITRTLCPQEKEYSFKHQLSFFQSRFNSRFDKSHKKKQRFYENNAVWLAGVERLPLFKNEKRGRPIKEDFELTCRKTKIRRTEHLVDMASANELSFAASRSFSKLGQTEKAKAINVVASTSTEEFKECTTFLSRKSDQNKPLTSDMALSTILDAQLSVHQYNIIREVDKWKFPAYKKVLHAKKECYPSENAFVISEKNIYVKLQDILNHTATRLLKSIEDFLGYIDDLKNLKLYLKWGIDGTSGFTAYKQRFTDPSTSDTSMMVTCFVPIRLVGDCTRANDFVFWKNPAPSSTRHCRPLHLNYVQETTEISVQEMKRVESEIKDLQPAICIVGDKSVKVSFIMLFTMNDGKICNAVTETSSAMRCYICKKTSSQFNCITSMRNTPIIKQNLSFGISLLHAWIRMFECLLHIGYKLCVAKWRVNNAEDKKKVENTKKHIQQAFKIKLGLIVDRPKPGYGSSNDGNMARRFFANPEVSSEITGVSKNLIYRFHVILTTLSSGHSINTKKFETYCLKTAVVFVKLYPWYYMPTSVHKILIHGPVIISNSLLPIGLLSEEAQEARNKEIKRYREFYSRKCSRVSTIRDVFNRLLVTSDPFISSLRKPPIKKIKTLLPEAVNMLMPSEIPSSSIANSSNETISGEDESDVN